MEDHVPLGAECFAVWVEETPERLEHLQLPECLVGGTNIEVRDEVLHAWPDDTLRAVTHLVLESNDGEHVVEGADLHSEEEVWSSQGIGHLSLEDGRSEEESADEPVHHLGPPIMFIGSKGKSKAGMPRRTWYVDANAPASKTPRMGTLDDPWNSLWPVRFRLLLGHIGPGDAVRFKRGSVWSVFSEALALSDFEKEISDLADKAGGLHDAIMDSLAVAEASFFRLGVLSSGKYVFLPFLSQPDVVGTDNLDILLAAYGSSGLPLPTFQGPLDYIPPSTFSRQTAGTMNNDGEGWPLAGAWTFGNCRIVHDVHPLYGKEDHWPDNVYSGDPDFDFGYHDWIGPYMRNVGQVKVINLRIERFNYGACIEGACSEISFYCTYFRFIEDKGCGIAALADDGLRMWKDSTGANTEYVAGYNWRQGHYPDDISFIGCTFSHIGRLTTSNALLVGSLTTGVTARWCVFHL